MASPLFSVIIATYNRAPLLPRSIRSVLNQNYPHFEVIVVDDSSEDHTPSVLKTISDSRVRYLRHPKNRGAAAAFNTGVEHAGGKFISFLGDDDEYLPNYLQTVVSSFDALPDDVALVWSGVEFIEDIQGIIVRSQRTWSSSFDSRQKALIEATGIGNGFGVAVKAQCIQGIVRYDERLRVGADTEFMFNLVRRYDFSVIPEILVRIYSSQKQLTHERHHQERARTYQIILQRNLRFLKTYPDLWKLHALRAAELQYSIGQPLQARQVICRLLSNYPWRGDIWFEFLWFELFRKPSPQWKLLFRSLLGRFLY